MTVTPRQSTGLARLDQMLGGGLLPGTLTVVLGATGIGKTQLGIQFASAGAEQESERGFFFDLTSRGDAQNHAEYARRLCGWELRVRSPDERPDLSRMWERDYGRTDYLHLFRRAGRRVTLDNLDQDQWREWRVEFMNKLDQSIAFCYGNFAHGVRRCVIDGVEPVEKESDSFQFHVIDYLYHQILRKDHDWVARDLFRAKYRQSEAMIQQHAYSQERIGCMLLLTSHETMLDDLLSRRIATGDVLSNANTIIAMGKVRDGMRMKRGLHVAKHRGSACDDTIAEFRIGERGLELA
jgi:KaiC/GvpD/RAD55 family RecA-like ATPase